MEDDAEREQEGVSAHAGDGQKEAGFAAEAVGERGASDGDDEVDGGDGDGDEAGGGGKDGVEGGDRVHDYGVDAAELLGSHDADDGDDGAAVGGVHEGAEHGDGLFGGVGFAGGGGP